jgi:hypothetical protein
VNGTRDVENTSVLTFFLLGAFVENGEEEVCTASDSAKTLRPPWLYKTDHWHLSK